MNPDDRWGTDATLLASAFSVYYPLAPLVPRMASLHLTLLAAKGFAMKINGETTALDVRY